MFFFFFFFFKQKTAYEIMPSLVGSEMCIRDRLRTGRRIGGSPRGAPERAAVDVHSTIDQILALVENARSIPMSGSCVVNRGELVQLVSDLREQLPAELQDARWVLERREAIIGDGREQAGRIVEDARAQAGRIVESAQAERARLVAQTEITAAATEEAERLVRDAHAGAEQVRDETDSYVDRKLAAVDVG